MSELEPNTLAGPDRRHRRLDPDPAFLASLPGAPTLAEWNARPLLLDLCCCAGGASVGYARAGFRVHGLDLTRSPRHPFPTIESAMDFAFDVLAVSGGVAAVHVSPPCQADSTLVRGNRARGWVDGHVSWLDHVRGRLDVLWAVHGVPSVIENPPAAGLRRDVVLCGEMFGLAVIRHRVFELRGWSCPQPPHPRHRGRVAGFRHGDWFEGPYFAVYGDGGGKGSVAQWQTAMGMPWTGVRRELAEAIPPAYSEFLGRHLLAHIRKGPAVPALFEVAA